VRLTDANQVTEFVEKPSADQIDTNNISAGAYVLERSVLSLLVAGAPASIERDVFPRLVGNGLFGHVGSGYWKDLGTPERYLEATFDILEGTVQTEVGARMDGTFVCVEDGVVSKGRIVPSALVESDCVIGEGARIGDHCVIDGMSVIGEGVVLGAHNTVSNGARLFPGVSLPDGGLRF
jgi:mannose-1-phosphate guanylyltransferase